MHTGGLLLDIDDDPHGETLRMVFAGTMPAALKHASVPSADLRERLPDDVFALVLVDGGQRLRKFACVDRGSTMVSTIYFLKNGHKLPDTAQKTAAQNLVRASSWYGLPVPEPLEKLALGALTALTAVPVVTGTAKQVRSNLGAVRTLERAGHTVVTPAMRASVVGPPGGESWKTGEASGTALMPVSEPTRPARPKTPVEKTAFGAAPAAALRSNPERESATGDHVGEKEAGVYGIGDRYPMQSYVQVQAASRYFDAFHPRFAPDERHAYATALVKRAEALGIAVSDLARKYGSATYAPSEEILAARDLRKNALPEERRETMSGLLDALVEKRAELSPEAFCAALEEFDRMSGLEHSRGIPDPYFSTYGFSKQSAAREFTEVIGADYVSENDLRRLARSGKQSLSATFNEDFVDEFTADPVGIFKSLPRAEKVLLMRMAADTVAA
ncbi:hypothetical protein LVJ94_34980 [Pendulispora rubella]|uniref:Uncharacterized protein n=1 Tax=Pendulispora rubella TaxID=2741070 RepID=A0ABZ2KTT8_9BACT